jgi:hypothetical protein
VTTDPAQPQRRWVHVSTWATTGLIIAVLAAGATLTGLLAPVGVALGALAAVTCLIGFWAVRRPNVTGHGLVWIGLAVAVAAVVSASWR